MWDIWSDYVYAHQMDDQVDFFKVTDITIITQIRDVFFQLKILTPVKVTIVTKVTDITGIFLGCHNMFWMLYLKGYRRYHSYSNYFPLYEHIFAKLEIPKVTKVTKVTIITGIYLVIHIWCWALHYQDYLNSLTLFF